MNLNVNNAMWNEWYACEKSSQLSASEYVENEVDGYEVVLDIEGIKRYLEKEKKVKMLLTDLKKQMNTISREGFLMYDEEFEMLGIIIENLVENKCFINKGWFINEQYYLTVEFPQQVKKCLSKYTEEIIMTKGYLNDKEVMVIYNANVNIIGRIRDLGFEHLDV